MGECKVDVNELNLADICLSHYYFLQTPQLSDEWLEVNMAFAFIYCV